MRVWGEVQPGMGMCGHGQAVHATQGMDKAASHVVGMDEGTQPWKDSAGNTRYG